MIVAILSEQTAFELIFLFTIVNFIVIFDRRWGSACASRSARDTSILESALGTLRSVTNEGDTLFQDKGKCETLEVSSARCMNGPFALHTLGKGAIHAGLFISYEPV